jgi:maleylacetoacetate isomerase
MTEASHFELYSYWRTSATYRVRVAFNLKGVERQEHNVDLDAGAQLDESFLKINPLGAIPALIERTGGKSREPLTQSLAILEFLEETFPSPALLPADTHSRARVRSISGMLAADTHPLITPRIRKYLNSQARFGEGDWRAWQTHWFTIGLQAVESRLSGESETGTFCHGDAVTMADICLASLVVMTRVFKIAVGRIPTVNRIMFACEKLDAFQRADPYRQIGAPVR